MLGRRTVVVPALLGLFAALGACNAITGASDLVVTNSGNGGATGSGDGTTDPSTGPDPSTGTMDPATTTDTSTSTGSPASTGTMMMAGADATGVTMTEIALYQGTKREVMQNGNPANSSIPIVANRDAVFRVFTTTDGSYQGESVTARVWLNGMSFEASHAAQNSSDANGGSTFNVSVPGSALPAGGVNMHVELVVDPASSQGPNPGAHFPASGDTSLNVQSSGQTLKLTFIPVQYGADGSQRLPDLSAGQLKAYNDRFLAIYPVPQVQITVHAAMGWNQQVSADGNGWDSLLNAIADLRAQDNPPNDVYYYGVFDPASSVNAYCGGGCVAGLGMIASAGDASSRAAIGLGFAQFADTTATHEVGHNHGRQHANCGGAQGIDPNYPYAGASIGVWGFDIVKGTLYDPGSTTDMMGYCDPTWVSDYTYKALFTRIKTVNGAQIIYPPDTLDKVYQRARVDNQGMVKFINDIKLHEPPIGEIKQLVIDTPAGQQVVTGHYFAYDHLDGGVVLWLKERSLQGLTIEMGGKSFHVLK